MYDSMNNWKIHLSFDIVGRTMNTYDFNTDAQRACLSTFRIFSDQSCSEVFCIFKKSSKIGTHGLSQNIGRLCFVSALDIQRSDCLSNNFICKY